MKEWHFTFNDHVKENPSIVSFPVLLCCFDVCIVQSWMALRKTEISGYVLMSVQIYNFLSRRLMSPMYSEDGLMYMYFEFLTGRMVSTQSCLTETEIMLHMINNDITMKESLDTYRQLFADCTLTLDNDASVLACSKKQLYFQRFIAEAVACYLVTGFVVFRFFEIDIEDTKKLVPIMVPISEIEWMYDTSEINYETDIVVPDVLIPLAGINNKTRFYMYKFANYNGVSSTSLGVVFTLVQSYQRWKQGEEYNSILQKENLRTTVYVEQKIIPDTSVTGNGGAHSVASAPLISRLTESKNYRTTTHAPPLPTPTEEIRDSIQVPFTTVYGSEPCLCDDI